MATTADNAILVETTILVDFLRQTPAAADYLDEARAHGPLICSVVTEAELVVGARGRTELRAIDQLLARFEIESITSQDSVRALKWLKKLYHARGVGFHDCLLGAAAVRKRVPLATLNEKHFSALPAVKVIRPY
jgi:tRNA(fMet)-specific endonuclease VapC